MEACKRARSWGLLQFSGYGINLLVKFVNGFATNKMCFCMCVCLRVCGHAFLFISFPRQNDDFNFLTCFALCVSCKCGVSFTLP